MRLPISETNFAENVYWVFGVVCEPDCMFSAKQISDQLADAKIGTRPFFWPLHRQPVLQRMGLFKDEEYPVADGLANSGFYLPSGLGTTNEQIDTVASKLKQILHQSL